jgi:hypothetical protein
MRILAIAFILITQGWEKDTRVHGCVVHLDIIDRKIWIQRSRLDSHIFSCSNSF